MPIIEFVLPANMEEIIKAGKYAEMVRILNTSYKTEGAQRFEMLKMLTGLNGFDLGKQLGAGNDKQRAKLAEEFSIEDCMEIHTNVFPAMDFIFGNEKFYVNPFPTFEHKGIKYAGPSSGRLSDQTGEEWMVSHQQMYLYSQATQPPDPLEGELPPNEQPVKYLRMLVAANYHQVDVNGKRKPFNEEEMEKDAEAFADLPVEIVMGIVVWYNHADSWWAENFEWLFTASDNAPVEEPDGKEIRHLLFELSGNKIDSAWDTVIKRSRQDIIYAMDRLEKRREEMEDEQPKPTP